MKKVYVLVEVTVDSRVLAADVREYVYDAVRGWGGSYHPDDPFFGSNKEVRILQRRPRKGRR